jgi:hypothetical protein
LVYLLRHTDGTVFASFLNMSVPPFIPEEFSVLHFSLIPSDEGTPTQHTQTCGVYRTVEEAFVAARLLAVREWQRLRSLASTGVQQDSAQVQWQVIDTEFGYDLKRDCLVVSRFWIHAKAVTEA